MVRDLYLAWQDSVSRRWFPVGRFRFDASLPQWEFCYLQGALDAQEKAGFDVLVEFPEFFDRYTSSELFAILQNRLMSSARGDYASYLSYMGFDPDSPPDTLEILARSGGRRATDQLELFSPLMPGSDGHFAQDFFLRRRHFGTEDQDRRFDQDLLSRLSEGQALQLALELNNPGGYQWAVQLQTSEGDLLGYTPNYLVGDLMVALTAFPADARAEVLRVNPAPAPRQRRVLVRVHGRWPEGSQPMQGSPFQSLAIGL